MSATPTYAGATTALTELPGSPSIEVGGGRVTRTRSYTGLWSLCEAGIVATGSAGTGDELGFVVTRCSAQRSRGDIGTLTIVYEAGGSESGAELPPLEYTCEPHRLQRPLKYHPAYASLTADILEAIDRACSPGNKSTSDYDKFKDIPLALALYQKRKRGTESYYIAGFKYSYTECSWSLPSFTLGGFLQTPLGPLAGLLPASAGWLREADEYEYTGAYHRIKRSWIGTPGADWDTDLYTA